MKLAWDVGRWLCTWEIKANQVHMYNHRIATTTATNLSKAVLAWYAIIFAYGGANYKRYCQKCKLKGQNYFAHSHYHLHSYVSSQIRIDPANTCLCG